MYSSNSSHGLQRHIYTELKSRQGKAPLDRDFETDGLLSLIQKLMFCNCSKFSLRLFPDRSISKLSSESIYRLPSSLLHWERGHGRYQACSKG